MQTTQTGPDLAPARAAVEALMDDVVRVTRNANATSDAVMGEGGVLVEPTGQPAEVYEGRGKHKHRGEGAGQSLYEIAYPIQFPLMKVGDRVEILASRRSQAAVGMTGVVYEVIVGTFALQNKAYFARDDVPQQTPGVS